MPSARKKYLRLFALCALFVVVLIGVFIALKFIVGFVWTIVKWMALGTLALGITYFVIFRKKGSTSGS